MLATAKADVWMCRPMRRLYPSTCIATARGVALQVDFFESDMWAFVGTFLALRVVTLAAASLATAAMRTRCYCGRIFSPARGHAEVGLKKEGLLFLVFGFLFWFAV
jgi:hypothetical protein